MLMSVCPIVTAIRNTGSHRLGRRIISTTNTRDGEADDDTGAAERRHEVEHPLREDGHVLLAPRRDRPVDAAGDRVRAHEEPEHAEHDAADDDDDEREHEQEAGLGLRVDARRPREATALFLLLELVGDRARGARRCRVDAGVTSDREAEEDPEHQGGPEQTRG